MKTVLVGAADTPTALAGVEQAAELARALGARLHVVAAIKNPHSMRVGSTAESWPVGDLEVAEQFLADLAAKVDAETVTTAVVTGDPGDALVDEAERIDADIVVVGNKRMHGVARVLGSVAKHVATHAHCAVYIANTVETVKAQTESERKQRDPD